MMIYNKNFTALILLLGAGSGFGSAIAAELAVSQDSASEMYVVENQGLAVLPTPVRSHIELFAGASFLYDSNTTQLADGEGGFLEVTDFGVNYVFGDESARGAYVGLAYLGQAFFYEDADTRSGRDSLEHALRGVVGVTGGKTRFRIDGAVYFNNGNSVDLERYDRETRHAASTDYEIDATVIRDLPHGTLEFGAGTKIRDFEGGTGLNDGSGYYGDVAWFYEPGFAPRSAFGLGVRAGEDDFDRNAVQEYVTPSFRWRYELSGKTSLYTSTGYEFRSIDGGDDVGSFVYEVGGTWAATAKTSVGLSSYRYVQPSYVSDDQNFTTTGALLVVNRQLPARFSLASTAGYEVAEYSGTEDGVLTDRQDDYFKAGVSLARELSLWGDLDGSISVFYNFSQNDSTLDFVDYDRQIIGLRVGIKY